ncbi:MAG: hypothetical protein LBM19_02240, partial [Holosporales bacterium]|nr:hypothetical protein [Holosporales bacterium]
MQKLLDKGNFKKIDEAFLTKSIDAFQQITKIQKSYKKLDTDTFMNEVRDSIAAKYLKYTHVNIAKHGLDARRKSINAGFEFDYLEVKSTSYDAASWQATFNDTNLEKANLFKERNIYLALSIWRAASELLFIVYGRNEGIGKFLEEKVKWFKDGNTVRSTQSITISDLVCKYGCK